ncbi:uncharacterized protein LOC113791671 [Dermatophagoides pteronyssinus]|uniref:uncharacterized protein LOC113791671 n=1 Tax=Dermatophagoides pteronyssinus TaxID=6956 RepID=UPI003F66F296
MSDISADVLLGSGFFEFHLNALSLGSIVNLSHYVNRLDISEKSSIEIDFNRLNISKKNSIEIDFNRKLVRMHFFVYKMTDKYFHRYKIEISFESIKFIAIDLSHNSDLKNVRFYFELNAAPFLFSGTKFKDVGESWKMRWNRIEDFHECFRDEEQSFTSILSNQSRSKNQELIGYAFNYRVDLTAMNSIHVLIYLSYTCKELNPTFSLYTCRILDASESVQMNTKQMSRMIDKNFGDNFAINYACRALFFKSYAIIDSITYEDYPEKLDFFFDQIKKLCNEESPSFVEEIFYSLSSLCKNRIFDLIADLEYLTNKMRSIFKQKKEYDRHDHVLMRRADLTASRIEFFRPMILLRSRFANIANLDYALRLTISEDNNKQLCAYYSDTDFIKNSIKRQLKSGIKIGDRLFEFLGSSSSQMRDSSIIFYACDDKQPPLTAQTIREMIGDLSDYKRKVAKYISRLGLIFSQAMTFYPYDSSTTVVKTQDLTTENKQFCFSDGIGIISKSLAAKFLPLLRIPQNYFPSAFQIRHGGCKGMLVCYEDFKKDVIIFRDSMVKFNSEDNNLGILKFSMARLLYLNRPFVQILDQQRVPSQVFHKFFIENIKLITSALMFENDALKLLMTYSNRNLSYKKLSSAGLSILNEPFMRRILHHLIRYRLEELKTRVRIPLPHTIGRMAFGVLDENRKLEPGEIFFQYSELDSQNCPTGKTFIIEDQIVMVTKFPCLSLGDVRKFRAVNIPELSHIKDCLVFPAKGERPHTDEMGGSDLDGDEFAITWFPDLLFPGDNYKPLDFTPESAEELPTDLSIDDIVEFYCDFLLENNVGQIANCHLMFSDFHPKGLHSKECEVLAKKYSISLDFQKNGVNATLNMKFKPNKNWIRPDFMEKHEFNNCYLSQKILGQMFRNCRLMENIIFMSDQYLCSLGDESSPKLLPNLTIEGWNEFESQAYDALIEYYHFAIETMEMMGIDSEASLISNVYEDKSDASGLVFDKLFEYFKQKFQQQAENKSEFQKLLLTSAWYTICFEKCHLLQYHYRNQPLLGLPFLIPDEIIKLIDYKRKQDAAEITKNASLSYPIDDEIISFTCDLIMHWIERLNELFNYQMKSELKILKNNKWIAYSEMELLKNFIEKKLREKDITMIRDEFPIFQSTLIENRASYVIFLFNYFMYRIFDLSNYGNEIIRTEKLEELMFLRYSIFALNFVNTINIALHHLSDPDKMMEIFRKQLDDKLQRLQSLQLKKSKFSLINGIQPSDKIIDKEKIDFNKMDLNFFRKIKLLTGAIYQMDIFDQENFRIMSGVSDATKFYKNITEMTKSWLHYPYDVNNKNCNNLNLYQIEYFTIEVIGFRPTISLLRLLLGHPDFYPNIYRKIQLPIPDNVKTYDVRND